MNITTFPRAADFLALTQAWLEEQEVMCNLMLGVSLRQARFPERVKTPQFYAAVADAGRLIAAAMMTPPFKLVVHGDAPETESAVGLIVENLIQNGWHVPGTLAPSLLARATAQAWTEKTGRPHQLGRRERAFELRKVNPLPPAPGRLRLATMNDLPLINEWAPAFMVDVGEPMSGANAEENVRRIQDQNLYIWEDGRPVSMAGATRPTAHSISVGLVYTPPELRRRGYARSTVAGISQAMLDAGWQFCGLFTDLANPTSNHIYQEIGYTPVCDFDEYVFAPSEAPA